MVPNTHVVIGTGNDETLSGTESDAQYTLIGGAGNDTYMVGSPDGNDPDVVIEQVGGGIDTVVLTDNGMSYGWTASAYAMTDNVENLRTDFTYGSSSINILGNALSNVIATGAGDDTLDGGLGSDTLAGGDGNDFYLVDAAGDVVVESLNGGTNDTVMSSATYTLGANIENLYLQYGAGNLSGTGNASDNQIAGNNGNNTLSGLAGNDGLAGGLGNDTLLGGDGNDFLHGDDFETDFFAQQGGNDSLDGGNGNDTLIGGFGNDTLLGGAGNDVLYGLSQFGYGSYVDAGADSLAGGIGDDTYYAAFGDTIVEAAASGNDTVYVYGGSQYLSNGSPATYTLAANVENAVLWHANVLNLTGNASDNRLVGDYRNNVLTGLAGNDALDGGIGADTLIGGDGNDSYIVDNSGDKVIETNSLTSGVDTVYSNLSSYTLSANVENLVLVYGGYASGTGNALNNTITGNAYSNYLSGGAGSDTLNGGAGGDWMFGGSGNDTYIIDNQSDHITEIAETNGGTADKAIITAGFDGSSYFMTSNLEILDASAYSGNLYVHANGSVNTVTTGAGNDSIDGAAGADTMAGGKGNDVYFVDNAGDVVKENLGEGTDTIYDLGINSYTLGTNVENLFLGGLNSNGTGNALANMIVGNSANNTLNGGDGNDTLLGGYGVDTLIGGNGDDVLDGGAKADSLSGGLGNDIYIIDNTGDVVAGETGGIDTIRTSLSVFSLTSTVVGGVSAVDNLIYTGSSNFAFTATGNLLANSIVGGDNNDTLSGGAGNDTLVGGSGADSMNGGTGDDTYYVDSFSDVIKEDTTALGGKDTVISSINFNLAYGGGADNVLENLKLTGTASYGGGNLLANTITGNNGEYNHLNGFDGSDTLIGGQFDDTLIGGTGADSMIGGTGSDNYWVDNVLDVVVETTADSVGGGWDRVFSTVNYTLGNNVNELDLLGSGNLSGTGNTLGNQLTGNDGNNTLSGLAGDDYLNGGLGNDTLLGGDGNDYIVGGDGADSMIGGNGDDLYSVTDDGDTIVELAGGGTDWIVAQSYGGGLLTSFNMATRAANVENIDAHDVSVYGGSFSLTGNALDNIMYGSWIVDNNIDGGAGNDTIILDLDNNSADTVNGGVGSDTLMVAIGHAYGDSQWTTDSATSVLTNIENVELTVNGGTSSGHYGAGYMAYGAGPYGGDIWVNGAWYGGGHTGGGTWDVGGLNGTNASHVNFMIAGGAYGSGTLELGNFGDNVDFTITNYHLDANYGGIAFAGNNWDGTGDTLNVTLDNATVSLYANGVETLQLTGDPTGDGLENYVWVSNVTADNGYGAVNIGVSGETEIHVLGIQTYQTVNLHDLTGYVELGMNQNTGDDSLSVNVNNVSAQLGSFGIETLNLNIVDITGDALNVSGVSGILNITGGTTGSMLDIQGAHQQIDATGFSGNLVLIASDSTSALGGTGDDYLIGSDSFDYLQGGEGDDVLMGNGGGDVFSFSDVPGNGVDTILDFNSGEDKILLKDSGGFDSSMFTDGVLNESSFYAADNADDANAETSGPMIMYDTSTGALYYDADGNGSGAATQFAQLGISGAPSLTASDIVNTFSV